MSAGAIRAGSAFVEIFANDSKFQSALKRVQDKLKATGAAMRQMGTQLAIGGAALGAPIALALRQFTSFDDAIRMTAAVAQATGKDLEALTNRARELGASTSFTATQVATLMGELGRAGFAADQINEMTGAVLDMSRATGTDATLAAGIMAATIRQFGMEAADAVRVADVLTAAANKTFNSVESLGEAFAYAGPVAAAAGMDLEETAAILGTLGNVGIQGSEAGTALRRLLTITGAEAEKLRGIFGVSFLDAAGNVRPLIDTLGEVAAATNNLASGERTAKFNEAFGLLGITSATVIGRVAADTRALYQELRRVTGTSADTARQMDAGLGGSLRILMSAVEGVAIAFGDAVAPSLQVVADMAQRAANVVRQFVTDFPGVAQAAVAISGALLGMGTALIATGIAFQIAGKAVAAMRVTLALIPALMNPVGLGLAALAGGVALWVANMRELSPAFRNETDAIMAAIGRMDFATAWRIMNLNFAIALTDMAARADEATRSIRDAFAAAGMFIGDKLVEGLDRFMGLFGADIITLQNSLDRLGVYFRAAFDWSFAINGMQEALDAADRKAAAARARAPTADARAADRLAGRQQAANDRQAAADAAPDGWAATLRALRAELTAVHQQSAQQRGQAAPQQSAAATARGQAMTTTATPEATATDQADANIGRTVGTFGSAEGLGIGPDLAKRLEDPAKATARNTGTIAAEMGGLRSFLDAIRSRSGDKEPTGPVIDMTRGEANPQPVWSGKAEDLPWWAASAGAPEAAAVKTDGSMTLDAAANELVALVRGQRSGAAAAERQESPFAETPAARPPLDFAASYTAADELVAFVRGQRSGAAAAGAMPAAVTPPLTAVSGAAIASAPAVAAAPAAAARAREGLEMAAEIRSLATGLTTGMAAVVRAVDRHAGLTDAGNKILDRIATNTSRPGAALS